VIWLDGAVRIIRRYSTTYRICLDLQRAGPVSAATVPADIRDHDHATAFIEPSCSPGIQSSATMVARIAAASTGSNGGLPVQYAEAPDDQGEVVEMTEDHESSPPASPAGPDSGKPQLDKDLLSIPLWRLLLYVVLAIAVLFLLEQTGILGV